ncbi:GNAT family N-acetyltransferase [Butyrivibrio sp. AE2015]|uniref:GNAT family N-acetyltransferase n=1 Tax=Butyrivibrio sp. AE2015 TaxID=1280663 RepID=UPI0003F7B82C|nr:GNAT family N-acetyltransferase [Butyrivibrio sp. AE2015]
MHRLYETQDITVFWNSDKCRHARKCVTGCPEVFDFKRKPWIDLKCDETQRIWKTVKQCPSGALDIIYNHEVAVKLDKENNRSIAVDKDGNIIGECNYQETTEAITIYHTEVNPEYGGNGIARRLVYKIFEEADRECKKIVATCSYAAKMLSN